MNSEAGAMEYMDAFWADALDPSSMLIKLWALLLWSEPLLLPCELQDFMSWLKKVSPGSVDWFVDEDLAPDAAVPLSRVRPWSRLEREFIITPD